MLLATMRLALIFAVVSKAASHGVLRLLVMYIAAGQRAHRGVGMTA